MCPSVGTLTVAFLDRFSPKLHRRSSNEFFKGQYRTISSPILSPKTPILFQEVLKIHANIIKYSYICLRCRPTRIADIFASVRKSESKNTMVTSDLRAEVETWPFRARAMYPAIGTVRLLWTWLWGTEIPHSTERISS